MLIDFLGKEMVRDVILKNRDEVKVDNEDRNVGGSRRAESALIPESSEL
jgi:hypothetical protein